MSTEKLLPGVEVIQPVIEKFYDWTHMSKGDAAARIEAILGHVRKMLAQGHLHHNPFDEQFRSIGGLTKVLLDKPLDVKKFAELLIKKNTAYGDRPLEAWGAIGVMIRIDSKFNRYQNLISSPAVKQGDEPIEDTLTDIIGYCVLGYRLVTRG